MAVFGSILTAVTAVAEAVAAKFRLDLVSAAYDLTERIEKDITNDENEILRLRALGDDASARIADRLRKRLIRRQGFFAHVSAASPAIEIGDSGADSNGDLHSPV